MGEGKVPLVYNRISKDTHTIMDEPFTDRMRFWDSLSLVEYELASLIDSIAASPPKTDENPVNPQKTEL